jgi:O-antigen/teichoic acid export membrane protein
MEGALLVPQAVAMAAYPTFSRIFHEGHAVRSQAEKLQRWLLIFCLPLMAGGILLAPRIIALFNEEYLPSIRVLQLLLVALPALYLNYLVGTLLRSVDRQPLNLYSAALAVVLNFGMNLLFIPPLGAPGAAIATALTQFAYFGFMYFFLRGAIGSLCLRAYLLKLCLCTVVMAGAIYPVQSAPLYGSIPLGAGVFLGIALLTGLVRREETREFLGFLRPGGRS